MTTDPRVYRSLDDRVVAGVCGGIAHYLGWSSTRFRIVYVALAILSAGFPGLLVYLALWFLIPDAPTGTTPGVRNHPPS